MFDPQILAHLAKSFRKPLQKLAEIENELNNRFTGMTEPIRALILSVASGEPLLLIGPPGTAKSRLIRAFCGLVGLLDENDPGKDHPDYFEYLLTPFTEPGELFGYYDIAKIKEKGKLERLDANMMQHAKVVYLDEVFNGSSAILNSILAFMNERIFHDRGQRKPVAMKSLFAATNEVPESQELRAIFDRFVLRCRVDNIKADSKSIINLLQKGWKETFAGQKKKITGNGLIRDLTKFRMAIGQYTEKEKLVPKSGDFIYGFLAQLIDYSRRYELSQMSNRRLVKMIYIMSIHRIYESACKEKPETKVSILKDDLQLMYRYFLDRTDAESIIKMERALRS